VVETGAPLATIVPAGSELIVEALVLNRDVGFVTIGQEVVVKLEAYPFTRYGYLEGIVEHVSADAIADETRGLVYPARIRMTNSQLRNLEIRLRALAHATSDREEGDARMRASDAEASADTSSRADISALISPGMSAQVEIITGRRSVLSYLLSPIARATAEAGRER
jgi:hemolysin D